MSKTIFAKTIRKIRDLGKEKKGIFVCNLDLKKSFKVGDNVEYIYDFKNKQIDIIKKIDGTHRVSFRKSEPDKPILDIKNKTVYELFKDAEKVEICFAENRVVVRLSTNQKLQNTRENNYGLSTFELFCGGATLSKMFRQAGFTPVGGIEINEKCLELAELNHDTFKYTILADIRDIHPTDYPKNINTLLVGIPCQPYSKGNITMQTALKNQREGTETVEDLENLENRYEAEALVFFILESIRHINPQNIVFEEVMSFSSTNACGLLRSVLSYMGYNLLETIEEGSHTKRKRWTMIATALKSSINLENLLPKTDKTIEDFLVIKSKDREWKRIEDVPRLLSASRKPTVGVRSCLPTDIKANTFTTHRTRSSEQALRKSKDEELYSEFTDEEIANIHGLVDYKLTNTAKWNRYVLGNGVTDMFFYIAKRLKQAIISEYNQFKTKEATISLVA
ncbi:DNA cytosine methyltransferase [Aliarcobacter butzleri]|uniref:DNA cytosine methyltransferase n=1 Tax=Aliarcobacter butzleri TaxID=28197 RepID=UPI00126A458E|nr:DNA cytosine methyltransferase [Aliarcobacter butzleri]